jgi:heme oxygenase (biliverdin-IX-beta and delta-forming)
MLGETNAGVLEVLKHQTRALHEQTEQVFPIMRPDLTLQAYGHILELFCGMYRSIEQQIPTCPSEPVRNFAEHHRRLPSLEDDISFLGSIGIDTFFSVPLPPAPLLKTEADWLGMLYVSEGSRLGGVFIAHHLEQHFGFSAGKGYSFFAGKGRKTREEWGVFCALCVERVPQSLVPTVLSAAQEAFRWYLACFQRLLEGVGDVMQECAMENTVKLTT